MGNIFKKIWNTITKTARTQLEKGISVDQGAMDLPKVGQLDKNFIKLANKVSAGDTPALVSEKGPMVSFIQQLAAASVASSKKQTSIRTKQSLDRLQGLLTSSRKV
jgi:hypothetical protein